MLILGYSDSFQDSLGGTRWRGCLRHYATSQEIAGSIPTEVNGYFSGPSPPSRIMSLGSTQPLTEMSARNFPVGIGRTAGKTDNLTLICKPIVYKMWGGGGSMSHKRMSPRGLSQG
jgi:hypothetical protein